MGAILLNKLMLLFITHHDEVITPSISDGALPGIMRSNVIKTCDELNIPFLEKSVRLNEIISYKTAFMTNCAIGIKIIESLDDTIFIRQNSLVATIMDKLGMYN